jgi:MFS family permease
VFAFLFGSAAALDAPVRQTFVAELVGDEYLSNAVALNSISFNAARMIGPALAGLLIAKVGTGWAFLLNGISFAGVLISMSFFRVSELQPSARARRAPGGFMEGFHYVWGRADLRAIMIMLFLIGTFGLNFPIFISTMAVKVLHSDAKGFGLLSSIMAVGTISGALLAAGRDKPRFRSLFIGAIVFSIGCTLAALSPGYWWFAGSLVQKVAAALADSLHPGTVLDGELVALDSNGNPHFNALQMLALSIREMQKELLLEGGIESSLGGLHGDYKALGLVSDFTKEKESSQTSREVARGSLPLFTAS